MFVHSEYRREPVFGVCEGMRCFRRECLSLPAVARCASEPVNGMLREENIAMGMCLQHGPIACLVGNLHFAEDIHIVKGNDAV